MVPPKAVSSPVHRKKTEAEGRLVEKINQTLIWFLSWQVSYFYKNHLLCYPPVSRKVWRQVIFEQFYRWGNGDAERIRDSVKSHIMELIEVCVSPNRIALLAMCSEPTHTECALAEFSLLSWEHLSVKSSNPERAGRGRTGWRATSPWPPGLLSPTAEVALFGGDALVFSLRVRVRDFLCPGNWKDGKRRNRMSSKLRKASHFLFKYCNLWLIFPPSKLH